MKYIFILALLLTPICASAVDSLQIGQKVITEGQVLRGHFKKVSNLQGFVEPIISKGHFLIAPGNGLIWAADEPFIVTTIIKPSGLVQKLDGNQVSEIPADKVPFMTELYNMLSGTLAGDWSGLDKDFVVTRAGTNDKWKITLEPRNKNNLNMPFSRITINGSKFVDHVIMKKPGGDTDNITFNRQDLSNSPLTTEEAAELQ